MIGVNVFKERGLTLTQKDPRDLLNGEARFRKRDGKRKGKDFYYELVVKCDDVYAISVCDWKDFQQETAKGLGPMMVSKLLDEALANIANHHAFQRGYANLQEILEQFSDPNDIPDDIHAAACTLWQLGQPVLYDGREWAIIQIGAAGVPVAKTVILLAKGDSDERVTVKAALLKAVDVVAKSKREIDA
jgi:hypothetical protein